MYCKHCGKEITDDAKFCPYCGRLVDDGNNKNSNADNVTNNNDYSINNYNTNSYAPYGQVPYSDTNGQAPYEQPVVKEYNIMSIIGIIFAALGFTSIVMGISGLICCIIGFRHAVKTGGKGRGFAIAGIIIALIAIAVQAIVIILQIIESGGNIDGAVYY